MTIEESQRLDDVSTAARLRGLMVEIQAVQAQALQVAASARIWGQVSSAEPLEQAASIAQRCAGELHEKILRFHTGSAAAEPDYTKGRRTN